MSARLSQPAPRVRPERIPLSYAQQQLWFLARLGDSGPHYVESIPMRISGACDTAALSRALEDVIARHEILRTVYPERNGVPHQRILDVENARPRLSVQHASHAQLPRAVAAAVGGTTFDLTSDPPLRCVLFHVRDDFNVLLLVLHHIAMDGWSVRRVLLRDITAAYTARLAATAPQWQPLPLQYADFALWQREMLGSERDPDSLISNQLTFWKRHLHKLPTELSLSWDHPRQADVSFRGGTLPFKIDARLHAGLQNVARESRATLFMVLHAAVAALLTRLGGGTDIPLGSPVSGRKLTVLNDLVGLFANVVVVRTDTSGNPTFRQLLHRVRQFVIESEAHQDLPFERLVHALNPTRSRTRNPLFQIMLGYQTAIQPARHEWTANSVAPMPLRAGGRVRFDLDFQFVDRRTGGTARGIDGTIRYATDLVRPDTAAAMAGRLIQLLRTVAADPDRPIGQIDLLLPGEYTRVGPGGSGGRIGAARFLIARFEQIVNGAPDAIAVSWMGGPVSYGALNARANAIAGWLIARGVAPGDIVGIAGSPGADVVAAVLAVLKAGAACLPIDPSHASAHLALLIGEAKPRLVLGTEDAALVLPVGVPVVPLADACAALTGGPVAANPSNGDRVRPLLDDDGAFAVYTSGTTGTPKGVLVTHRAVAASLEVLSSTMWSAQSQWCAVNTLASDVGLLEVLAPLSAGATVVLPSPDELLHAPVLANAIAQSKATAIHARPSQVRRLLPYLDSDVPANVFATREPLTADFIRTLRRSGRSAHQLYGTTEVGIVSAVAVGDASASSLGTPLPHTRAYLLDPYLQLAPVGVVGELYVAGDGLARGYIARPGLTASCFVADPHGPPGSRMFRTGDRGRWNGEGRLEWVAVAGVEAGELRGVEMALRECSGVIDAVVVDESTDGDGRRRIAYVARTADTRAAGETLLTELARVLPAAVLPDVIVPMGDLPRTPNGALDRHALPAAPADRRLPRKPATEMEERLCALFAEVLGVSSVGVDDNFFALGGHSILATTLINRARTRLGIELDIRTIFDAPTVATLAPRLSATTFSPAEPTDGRTQVSA